MELVDTGIVKICSIYLSGADAFFHANLLECVKSMLLAVSSQHSLYLWFRQFVRFETLMAASLPGSVFKNPA